MAMTKIPSASNVSSRWAKGSTTELYIYPRGASLADMQFDIRLSLATIETETSLFTPLPQVERQLMVLQGQLQLTHSEHHQVELLPLQQDRFHGEWLTTSQGVATNFNMMTKGECHGMLRAHQLKAGESIQQPLLQGSTFIYLYKGCGTAHELLLNAGDAMLFEDRQTVVFNADQDSVLIEANFLL